MDLKSIARGTAGFAGADLENLLNEAAIMATRSKRRFIMQADIDEAILKVVMGPEKKSRVVSERARRLTAYHESGHAIASFFLKNSDPVHYITIIPRGAAGGFTWYRKAEDAENFTSRGEMFDSIVSALGGRIAEQLFLDDISTGASNDIQQATNIARDMVMKYGMSEKLGPISFDDSSHSIFIGRDFGTTKSYSEETAATIDEEVKHMFDQAYAKCEALLREHADLLTGLAEYLLIHETIEGDDFRYYCEHGEMPVHPDDTIEPPAKVIRRMDEGRRTAPHRRTAATKPNDVRKGGGTPRPFFVKGETAMLYTFGGKAPQVDPTAFISASAELIGDVIVGPRCYIGPYAVIRADASRIVLEEEVAVEDGVIIHTGGEDPVVTISRRVTIGHGAIIHARVIGPEASIGMGAVLSLCSEIGAGSIVAESALVPQGKIIPPETLVAGVPARPLRELTDKDRTDWRETKDWYVRMAAQYLDPDNYHPVK